MCFVINKIIWGLRLSCPLKLYFDKKSYSLCGERKLFQVYVFDSAGDKHTREIDEIVFKNIYLDTS